MKKALKNKKQLKSKQEEQVMEDRINELWKEAALLQQLDNKIMDLQDEIIRALDEAQIKIKKLIKN